MKITACLWAALLACSSTGCVGTSAGGDAGNSDLGGPGNSDMSGPGSSDLGISDSGGGGDASPLCPMGFAMCQGVCVDVTRDPANCGACKASCAMGATCESGRCRCPQQQSVCAGACVDTANDNTNCGGCGTVCPMILACKAGVCSCPVGQTLCGNRCVDVVTDNANCGACGTACPQIAPCGGGKCVCGNNRTLCGQQCVDVLADLKNCGACAVICPQGQLCGAGKCTPINACGDVDPACKDVPLGANGAAFPLRNDMQIDPAESDWGGLARDMNGNLVFGAGAGLGDFLWVANSSDWNRGTVSKIASATVRETARYFSVTCNSLPTGGQQACDGQNGCCALDDDPRWQARRMNKAQPPHQGIQLKDHAPSRTALDYNGDALVANRAFGGQSSVTRIANNLFDCRDRNGNGVIDTSSDVNGNGLIETDCNGDALPDDLATVKQKPCKNGLAQEFYGLDDECVLFTTNTFAPNSTGRPLALGPGVTRFGVSDAWAGGYNNGKLVRIDGATGLVTSDVQLGVGCNPYGAAIDLDGYGWVVTLAAGPLCYFDTGSPKTAAARTPDFGPAQGYGIAVDRDQNIWLGGLGDPNAYRYTPDRSQGWNMLGNGVWTFIQNAGKAAGAAGIGRGIAADSRTPMKYWVWLAASSGYIVRLPGSDLAVPMKDTTVDGSLFPAVRIAGTGTSGAGVDRDQDVWAAGNSSVLTRILVDGAGTMTAPDIASAPQGQNRCPAGDRCSLRDNMTTDPGTYSYSDFTGFGLRNFTRPRGSYAYVVKGCADMMGRPADTRWWSITYRATVPMNTSVAVHARSGRTPVPDASWGAWTKDFISSPVDLRAGMPLVPNDTNDGYLQVEFELSTNDRAVTPVLKGFDVAFKCN